MSESVQKLIGLVVTCLLYFRQMFFFLIANPCIHVFLYKYNYIMRGGEEDYQRLNVIGPL